MEFESTLVDEPQRRVVIELPQERANALADALDENINWCETAVADELGALYVALRGE